MRLTKLHLQGFRNHHDSVLDCGDSSFVVIRGRNFAGKSSIAQAFSMCVTPSTAGLDAQGRGYISKIKKGESKAVITADIQTKRHLIQRIVTLNSNTSGRTQQSIAPNDPEWTPTPFDRKLEASRAALTVALNTDAFLRMDEKEQKNLLASLALPDRYDFDKDIVTAVKEALGEDAIYFEGEPFLVIQQAYKNLFNERQIVNRQVRDFAIPEALPRPEGDSQSLQEQLTLLRSERRERQQQRDGAVVDASRAEAARSTAKAKLQSVQNQIDDDEHRAVSIRAFLLSDDQRADLRKLAEGRAALDEAAKEKEQIEGVIDDLLRKLGRLDDVPEAGKDCPQCGQFIDPEKLKQTIETLSAELHEAKNENQFCHDRLTALQPVQEAVDGLAKHDDALKELAAIEARVQEKRQALEAARRELPEAVLFDFAPYDRSIAECDVEIERLSAELRPMIVAEERQKEIEVKLQQLAGLKQKAAALDRLVKYFDKDGIKAKLLGEYIGGFEHRINEVMSAWGYSCALSIDPYMFDVTNARGDTNPVRELSGAERVMFSLAFQCAVSRTASLGLVVIDEVAMFLPELRPVLNKRLYEEVRNGNLEQVILLVADASEQVPRLPGAAFFMVDGGTIRTLPQPERKEVEHERRDERDDARSYA